MCLTYTLQVLEPSDEIQEGYKVFERCGHKLCFKHQQLNAHIVVPTNQWLIAENNREWTLANEPYKTGFHIFKTIEDVIKYGYFTAQATKVKYRKARLLGIDGGAEVVIADEMYVESEQ